MAVIDLVAELRMALAALLPILPVVFEAETTLAAVAMNLIGALSIRVRSAWITGAGAVVNVNTSLIVAQRAAGNELRLKLETSAATARVVHEPVGAGVMLGQSARVAHTVVHHGARLVPANDAQFVPSAAHATVRRVQVCAHVPGCHEAAPV